MLWNDRFAPTGHCIGLLASNARSDFDFSRTSRTGVFEAVGHLALRSNCEKAWFGWPCDEAIEKLRADFTMIPDLEGRKANARAVQLRAVETVPYVPVGQFYLVRGYRKDLTGLLSAGHSGLLERRTQQVIGGSGRVARRCSTAAPQEQDAARPPHS
jgi:hypothetical protein